MGSRLESNSNAVRKRIENHTFDDEDGDEYESSKFGGFSDYFRRKKIKLQNRDAELRSQSADKPPIFRGIVAHVNGYTQPSLNDLHKLIVSHGGGFMQYLDGKTTVTHIIASSLTPKKAMEFKRYRIVKPAWVVESVKAGKLLPWDSFRVLDEGAGQRILRFDNGKVVSQANTLSRGYRDQTDTSWYTSQLKGADSTPSGSVCTPFLKNRPPTPDEDDIVDLPPSHQPEFSVDDDEPVAPVIQEDSAIRDADLVTPPKTSSPFRHLDSALSNSSPDPPVANFQDPDVPPARNNKRSSDDDVASLSKKTKLTAEEHNAILLADPKIRKSTVVDPNFLDQYYRESRLHHLSTWKADLKSQLQVLAAEKSSSQKTKQKRAPGARRYILHVDFDSFFAAVSLKKHPEYKEKPAVVAHGNGSGSEIASCNYHARKFGVKNGMWMKRAQELCPELKILPYDFPAYEEASRSFYDCILATDGIVQSVSVDEALVDISTLCAAEGGSDGRKVSEGSIYREQAKADGVAQALRDEIRKRTGCNVSVGIGGNILLAKLALRKAKPAGQHQIKPEDVLDFIGDLQVQDLPGVAWSTGGKLEEIGIKLVKDIRDVTKERLVQTLGPKTGDKLWEYSRGIDRAEVGEQVVRKSVSAEVNWGVRFENQDQADEFVGSLCAELSKRLLKERVKGRQFTMKIMRRSPDAPLDPPKHLGHGKCDTHNKSLLLGVATNATEVLAKEALSIMKGFGFSPGELRGIGVQMTKLEPIKAAIGGQTDGSQRRLQFRVSEPKVHVAKADDPIQDDIQTPKKPRAQPDQLAFGAESLNKDSPSRRPLNTLGTQFILPSQVDPQVLAELPGTIRAKLARHARPTSPSPLHRARPRKAPFTLTALPAESQLDPEILAALPDDVKAEVLAQYQETPGSPSRRTGDQPVLPQSSRENRILPPVFKKSAPTLPRKRGRPPKSATSTTASGGSTLTQSNFITTKTSRSRSGSTEPGNIKPSEDEDLDPDFLAALPEDLRREVLEEHRRKRLEVRSNLAIAANNARKANAPAPAPYQPRLLQITRPKCPTFTTQTLWQMDELREAITAWCEEFREDGPYKEDLEALGVYLVKVVEEEGDLAKAVAVVKWLVWVVEEGADSGEKMDRAKWEKAVERVKDEVQGAIKRRGLGRVEF
ncbi:DNA repair protein [Mytilinidion resinicola]|uniref:DNA repair protein REV1 n=1 Tax=Mytilinidion resinicola TaxID=574789 RepID=A0A6A6YJ37_9PEZI|nr:DNA repair protein [Mytilinidion resinicola]KAF2807937.1 DNA repair protein [Mytilinidion resinicola]